MPRVKSRLRNSTTFDLGLSYTSLSYLLLFFSGRYETAKKVLQAEKLIARTGDLIVSKL